MTSSSLLAPPHPPRASQRAKVHAHAWDKELACGPKDSLVLQAERFSARANGRPVGVVKGTWNIHTHTPSSGLMVKDASRHPFAPSVREARPSGPTSSSVKRSKGTLLANFTGAAWRQMITCVDVLAKVMHIHTDLSV